MKRVLHILILCAVSISLYAQDKAPTVADTVYCGTTVKFDIGSAVYLPIRHKGQVQNYELGISVDLLHRYFPVIEMGYSQARQSSDYEGYGGFARIGLDYSVLRKYKGPNHFLVGLRVGTSMQTYDYLVERPDLITYSTRFGTDAWGEIVAGVQVQVWKSLCMGWQLRYKILFTRSKQSDDYTRPAYIMGFGTRDDTAFGWNYFIGWTF